MLIDTVSSIVKTHGIGILSEPRFWNILTDSYSFGADYSLRDTFKKCISEGYVFEIVSLKGKSQKTIDKIKDIVAKEHKISPSKNGEYTAILFSVAIAIGTCTKKDYSTYNNPPSAPQKKPKYKTPINLTFGVVFSTFIGLLLLVGGTFFYGLYIYEGWWMFFIMLFMGLAQSAFCAFALNIFGNNDLNWNKETQRSAVSCYLPIIVGYICNAFAPFFFCSNSFREKIIRYFSDNFMAYETINPIYHREYAAPGALSIILTIIVIFVLFSCGLGLYSDKYDFRKKRLDLNYKCLWGVSLIIVFAYSIFFSIPTYSRYSEKKYYYAEQNRIEQERDDLIKKNKQIHNDRINSTKELSFKGIRLGISYDTAIEYAKALTDDNSPYTHASTYNFIISSADGIIDAISKNEYLDKEQYQDSVNYYTGQSYTVQTILDNKEVYLTLYEQNGLIFAMIIGPNSWSGSTFNDISFDELLKLYTTKYGEPENLGSPLLDNEQYRYGRDKEKYLWQFRNGTVQLTNKCIIYATDDFIRSAYKTFVNDKIIRETRQRQIIDSIRIEQNRLDSIRHEESLKDSLRRIHSHQNAINEI